MLVKFEGYDQDLEFTILGSSIEVPIYLEEALHDFRCVVHGKLYRKKLLIHNRGKIAMKCIASVPPKYKDYISTSRTWASSNRVVALRWALNFDRSMS